MIDALLSIIDRLINLIEYRNRRFRALFTDIIEPTFNDLREVHADYIKMFHETYRLLPREAESTLESFANVKDALDYLSQKRLEFEPVRVKLAALSEQWNAVDLESDVERFAEAILNYFPNACVPRGRTAAAGLERRIRYWGGKGALRAAMSIKATEIRRSTSSSSSHD